MNYDDEHWIKVYTRDTAGWLALSWQARGLMLEIARRLPKQTGELSLGRRGLEAIAALVRAPWAEVEPFIRELIADGRLEYDEEASLIRDPQHADRQNAIASDALRSRNYRSRQRHAPSRTVTRKPRAVTQQHAPSLVEEKRREEKDKKEDPPSGDLRAREGLVVVVTLDMPFEADAEKIFDSETLLKKTKDPGPTLWSYFVDHYAGQQFAGRQAVLGKWRSWVKRQPQIDANNRGRSPPKADTRQPLRDPNPDWLRDADKDNV